MMIHTPSFEFRLPGQKIKKLKVEANKLGSLEQTPSAWDVSRVLGKMNAVSQAVSPAPPPYRHIQRDLVKALEKGNQCYNAPCSLSDGARTDLNWWAHHQARWSEKSLLLRKPDLTIESNASLTRLGSHFARHQAGGPLVPIQEDIAHKLPRTTSCYTGSANIPQRSDKQTCLFVSGQHDCSSIHQQPGGHSITPSKHLCKRPLDVVPGEGHYSISTTPSREAECDC